MSRDLRPILLLVILAGLVAFAVQNLATVLPLVFLGSKTLALPVAVWMLGALLAGALTSLAIARLVTVDLSPRRRPRRRSVASGASPRQPVTPSDRGDRSYETPQSATSSTAYADDWGATTTEASTDAREEPTFESAATAEAEPANGTVAEAWYEDEFFERWEEERVEPRDGLDDALDSERDEFDEFDELEDEAIAPPTRPTPAPAPVPIDYEVRQEPKSQSWQGSVYSYTYREASQHESPSQDSTADAPDARASVNPFDLDDGIDTPPTADASQAPAEEGEQPRVLTPPPPRDYRASPAEAEVYEDTSGKVVGETLGETLEVVRMESAIAPEDSLDEPLDEPDEPLGEPLTAVLTNAKPHPAPAVPEEEGIEDESDAIASTPVSSEESTAEPLTDDDWEDEDWEDKASAPMSSTDVAFTPDDEADDWGSSDRDDDWDWDDEADTNAADTSDKRTRRP